MIFNEELAQAFAKTILDAIPDNDPKQSTAYATVVQKGNDGTGSVRIDGSSVATPATFVNDAEVGDRVAIMYKDRQVVVTGNVSNPASANVENMYMRMTEDGLVIGEVDGYSIRIEDDAFVFMDSSGTVLARLSIGSTTLGNALLLLASVIGIRSISGTNRAEVIASGGTDPQAAMQVALAGVIRSAITATSNGVYVTTPLDSLPINGSYALKEDTAVKTGSFVAANQTIRAGRTKLLNGTVSASLLDTTEYHLVGLSGIDIRKSDGTATRFLRVRQFSTTPNGGVSVSVLNASDSDVSATLTVTWFAVRSSAVTVETPEAINLDDDDPT